MVDHEGHTLGTVVDLIIDSALGNVADEVVASGGFMGLGEVRYVLPWDTVVALEGQAGFRCRDVQLLARYQLV